jgi:transcriptional regulator with XRE-family HTH domain
MSGSWTQTLNKELANKEFRDAYVAEDIRTSISFQIRVLREKRGWSQAELGLRAAKPQSVIARLEDPDYGRFSLRTLLEMATAFDVGLLVRFVSFSELIRRNADVSPDALAVQDYAHDTVPIESDVEIESWPTSERFSSTLEVIDLHEWRAQKDSDFTEQATSASVTAQQTENAFATPMSTKSAIYYG